MGNAHLQYWQRQRIERWYNGEGKSPKEIAALLGYHYTNIYKELKRGMCDLLDTYLRPYRAYSADVAQQDHEKKVSLRGPQLKIGKDFKLVEHVEHKIKEEKYSPDAVIGEIKEAGLQFDTSISTTTLYRYIDKGLFLNITNKDLPTRKKHKRKYKKVKRVSISQPTRTSIEERPKEIDLRNEFGHWEMDTVEGPAKGKSTCLLVLTERKTRQPVIVKLRERTASQVEAAIDQLERRFKGHFSQVFKTITVDNGSEFSNVKGIEKGGRTKVYFCHPYSSYERGSNENGNKLIRRFIPKGTPIKKYTQKEIAYIEHWIANYPRKLHGYKSSQKLYIDELTKLSRNFLAPF